MWTGLMFQPRPDTYAAFLLYWFLSLVVRNGYVQTTEPGQLVAGMSDRQGLRGLSGHFLGNCCCSKGSLKSGMRLRQEGKLNCSLEMSGMHGCMAACTSYCVHTCSLQLKNQQANKSVPLNSLWQPISPGTDHTTTRPQRTHFFHTSWYICIQSWEVRPVNPRVVWIPHGLLSETSSQYSNSTFCMDGHKLVGTSTRKFKLPTNLFRGRSVLENAWILNFTSKASMKLVMGLVGNWPQL